MGGNADGTGIFATGLDRNAANFAPLTPLSFLAQAAAIHPGEPAVVHLGVRRNWGETYARCRRLAGALAARGIGRGDTVAVLAANIPEMFEAHFGVPMAGAVLNTINTRLDAATVAYILGHGEAKALLVDAEFAGLGAKAAALSGRDLLLVDIEAPELPDAGRIGALTYEALLAEGDPAFDWKLPADEWDAISLNYTSGTTGHPKGVVYHHRGAALNAWSNILTWDMPRHARYLWTLPMFHCNGWCFPWTLAANAGTAVCLRAVRSEAVFDLIRAEKVTHFCGAPVVLNTLAHAPDDQKAGIDHTVRVMTAGAPPPAAVIGRIEATRAFSSGTSSLLKLADRLLRQGVLATKGLCTLARR